jgi:biopolymer transport protein ExbB
MQRAVMFGLILLFGSIIGASPARAWWNADWNARMKITADAGPKGANVTKPIGRTQVLIRLHSGNFNFDTAKENGEDIRVIASDDRTPLHYHIERFDGLVDQIGLIWVDIPDLAPSTATSFYLYWGNKNAQPGGDAKATYDPDQLLVYHFTEENGVPHDSTGYGNNALTAGKRDDGGMIGYGLRLDGTNSVQIPASPSLAITANEPMTWSVWARPNDGVNTGLLYSQRDGQNSFTIGLDHGVAYAEVTTADGTIRTSPGTPVTDGYHLITVTTGTPLRVYVDGDLRGEAAVTLPTLGAVGFLGGPASPAAGAVPAAAAPPPGAAPTAAPPPPPGAASTAAPSSPSGAAAPVTAAAATVGFAGVLDEFHISKVVRPAGSFRIEVASDGPKPTLLTFDTPEQSSVLGNSYFGIIIRSVTPDAWVVIGILGVMALVSWTVMASKALYFAQIGSANRLFRTKFREAMRRMQTASTAPDVGQYGQLAPGGEQVLRRSPLYRLYRIGITEVQERAGRLDTEGRLPAPSMAAIRSALDGALARENQRLNNRMVLLTIAISGGPFLGLLGTVVGVMITFAAIAAAGDVNINAIAPGISAALLATVAGLAVAIPALFGYNYFTVRIRDTFVDMQVFIDELITRLGEGIEMTPPPAQPPLPAEPSLPAKKRAAAE